MNQDYGKNLLQLLLISYPNISSQWFLLGTAAGKKPFEKCQSFMNTLIRYGQYYTYSI